MRFRWFPLIVGALALAALAVHFAVPFAHVVTQDGEGAVVADDVMSLGDYKASRESAETSIVPSGAGFTYMTVSLIFMATGALLFALFAHLKGEGKLGWFQLGAGTLTAIGGAMTLHNQGLWAGRGFNAWIQKIMGWDNPPLEWTPFLAGHSSADLVTYLTTISPAIVLALTVALIVCLAKGWAGLIRVDRDLRGHAQKHGRLAIVGALTFVLVVVMPWVVTVMPGSVQPAGTEAADDTFFWGAYDVFLMQDASLAFAMEANELGNALWSDLGTLLGIVMLTSLFAVLAPFAGIAGKHMESLQQPVFGRLVESMSLATVLLHPFTIIAALLASFTLLDPSDLFSAKTTGIAMIAAAGGLTASVFSILVARVVVADETGIVADDFPEPVVYD